MDHGWQQSSCGWQPQKPLLIDGYPYHQGVHCALSKKLVIQPVNTYNKEF